MDNIIESHYFILPTQSNVYSFVKLNLTNGTNKILVASLKRKIFSFEYSDSLDGFLKPCLRELSFTYIPNGAEIISVDAFNKSKTCDDFYIGITIIKPNADHSPETYLNIYSEQDLDSNGTLNLENVAQNCLMVELNFIPYQLCHAELKKQDDSSASNSEIVWLISGSDSKIHVFCEDRINHTYNEVDTTELFPEIGVLPSIAMWIDIQYVTQPQLRRITAVGCECGYVQLSIVDVNSDAVLNTFNDQYDGPISRISIFGLKQPLSSPPDSISKHCSINDNLSSDGNDVNLLVVNTLQPSVVYMNIFNEGLSTKKTLADSDLHDVTLCACVADIDMDSCKEILIGTYAQKLLTYKYCDSEWKKTGQIELANPIHGIQYLDVTGDGVKELLVLTLCGVHIMQHNPDDIYTLIMERIKKVLSIPAKEELQ